ncbi:MAG: tetratricopeptide repeat protein [Phycisphaerales bacterium]|nr:tetratricopeptide repeat protein [Phycisphaerales bacterium]
MAAKINTKFIIIVGAALLALVAGVTYLGVQALRKSGEDYIKLGDAAMAAGKANEAVGFYGRAVFKDQRNAAWIRKWMAAMKKDIPQGRVAYMDAYDRQYRSALRTLPEADPTDFDAHRDLLEEMYAEIKASFSADPKGSIESLEYMIKTADEMIANFKGDQAKGKLLLRYRALPRVNLITRSGGAKQSEIDSVKKDFAAVLSVDPADSDAALGLMQADVALSEATRKRGDTEEADRILAEAKGRLRDFVSKHPPASKVRLALLLQEVDQAARASEKPVTLAEVIQDRKQMVQELIDAVKAEKPEDLEVGIVDRAAQFAVAALPAETGRAEADAIIAHALKGKPDDAPLLMAVAMFEIQRNQADKAEATLQKIVDMPDKPLSYEGKQLFGQRLMAILAQTDVVFAQWEAAKEPAARDELAARAKNYRDSLVAKIGDTAPEVLSLDARLLYIQGDRNGSRALLTRYNELTGQKDARSMALLGQLLLQQGNTGAAKQSFQRVLERDPRNVRALRYLGKIEQDAGNYAEAQRYLKQVLALIPQDEELRQLVDRIDSALSSKDPIGVELLKIEQTARGVGADIDAAVKMAEKLVADHPKDLRPYAALVQLEMSRNNRPAAVAALKRAETQFPENKQIKETIQQLEADPVPQRIAAINSANVSTLEKAKAMYAVYSQGGDNYKQQADAAFDELVRLAPDDPAVFEFRFMRASIAKDSKVLSELVAVAEAKNLDQVNGQLYRARQLITDGKLSEAVGYLRGTVEKDKQNQAAWRTLGMVQLELRDASGAADALAKAVEIRPNDIVSINGLLRALIMKGSMAEALDQARKSETIAGADPEFAEIYITLLTEVAGGDKQKAEVYRERIARANPADKMNQAQLAALRIEQRKYDDAKACIDDLAKDEKNRDIVTELRARWFAAQGKFADTEKVYDDYIAASPPEKKNEAAYIAAARTFMNVGQPDRALAFLEKGRAVEKPETMMISREMGDVLFNVGKPGEAAAAYKRVLDAGSPDTGDALVMRVLECYQKQKEWAKFDALMSSLGDKAQKNATLLVLAAEAALQQGDDGRARKLYDQAVVADSKNPIVFLKRGDFAARDPANEKDAILDFEQASRLRPSWTLPLQRIAIIHRVRGRLDLAAETVRRIIEIDPDDDSARMELISIRMKQNDRVGVVALIDDALKHKKDHPGWLMRAGQIMSDLGDSAAAATYYAKAWEQRKSLDVAVPYVTALLAKAPADATLAWTIASAKEIETADEMSYRLLRAMVLQRSGRGDDAYAEIERAYLKIDPNDPNRCQLFAAGVDSAHGDDLRGQLATWEKLDKKKKLDVWLYVQACRPRLQDQETRDATAAAIEGFIETQTDPSLKLSTYRMMASFYYQTAKFDRAAGMYRKFLELEPNDAETLNNLAYTLAVEMKQPGEAARFAEKAVELSPKVSSFVDTLGVIQLGLKNTDEAVKSLRHALELGQSDNERAPILIHLAMALISKGEKSEARTLVDQAANILNNTPPLKAQYQKELKDVTDQLDGQ